MNMQDIRKMAKRLDISTKRVKKLDLVRSIQLEEGNFACFMTAEKGTCDQDACLWRKDCLKIPSKKTKTRTMN